MRETNGTRVATAEHAATPSVALRFTRAAEAERSRLEGKREQLLRKREAVQAELAEIDRAVGAIGELLELLAPLLPANGSEPGAAGDDSRPEDERGGSASGRGEADERDPTPPSADRSGRVAPPGRSSPTAGRRNGRPPRTAELPDPFGGATNQRQPTKEQSR